MLLDHIATAVLCGFAMLFLGYALKELWQYMPPVQMRDLPYYFGAILVGAAIFPIMWVVYAIWG